MGFCTNCGNRLSEGSAFCTRCGSPVLGVQPGPVSPPEERTAVLQIPEEPVIQVQEPMQEEPVVQTPEEPVIQVPVEEPKPVWNGGGGFVAPFAPEQEPVPAPPRKKKERKPLPKVDKSKLLGIGKIAVLVLILVALIGGIGSALYLSLRTPATLDTPSGVDTMASDGALHVALRYDEDALLFDKSGNARMELVLTNVSDDIIRDLSVDLTFPEELHYVGDAKTLDIPVLSPGGSYSVSLPVEQVVAMDRNFTTSLIILIVLAVVVVALVVGYALLCGAHAKSLKAVTACLLIAALMLPTLAPIVRAAGSGSTLVYEDGSQEATAIAVTRTSEERFALDQGKSVFFSYTAQYTCEQHILLDAVLSDDGETVSLQWNEISDADQYRVYTCEYGYDYYELTTTDSAGYVMDAPSKGTIWMFRVAAQTALGDVYTNDLQLIVGDESKLFVDNDGDQLSNEIEDAFGTSQVLEDTDGDGISDYDEVALTMTDPVRYDSDGDGVGDGDADQDGDGLTNLRELEVGTAPLVADSDGDGLDDRMELEDLGTDPIEKDTDWDGLLDGSEHTIGTDPTKADTDDDGTWDCDDDHAASLTDPDSPGARLDVTDSGDQLTAAEIRDITEDTTFADQEYVASPVIMVQIPEDTQGQITLPIADPSRKDEVVIAVYNEEDGDFRILEDSQVSEDGTTVSVGISKEYVTEGEGYTDREWSVTTQRSTYVAFYIANWHAMFQAPLSPDRDGNVSFDVSFVIDESSSMEDNAKGTVNDPERYRVEAAKRFTEALVAGDRAAVVGFNEGARRKIALSEDMVAVRAAIDSIVGNAGGTALYAGLQEALAELIASQQPSEEETGDVPMEQTEEGSTEEEIKEETGSRGRFIIALTDGEDSNSDDGAYDQIIADCVAHQIPIYTIGLGSSVNTSLLTKLATYTGGTYIHIQNADDLPQVFNRIENTAFYGDDTDGDGLADSVEEHGLRDGSGRIYFTDASLRFTDEDDLSDGEEAGNVMYTEEDADGNVLAYYIMLTDPSRGDTDGDGVDDLDETIMKTLPWCYDTDGDGLSDGEELALGYDPTDADPDGDTYDDSMEKMYSDWSEFVNHLMGDAMDEPALLVLKAVIGSVGHRDPYSYDLSGAEKGVALLEGALLGDFGDMLAEYGIVDSRHTSSMYYYIGGIIIGFIPIASAVAAIRDAIAATIDGDWLGALLSLVGIIPGGGAVMEAVDMIAEIVGYVCDAAEAAAEYPSSITIQNAAAAPALTYVLLMIYRKIEVVFGLDLGTSQVKKMVQQQADLGLRGLTKDRVENWEAFLSYGDQTQDVDVTSSWSFTTHRAEDALGEPQTIQLGITNESHPMTLVRAVREAFGQVPGGTIVSDETGTVYTLVRALDLESTEYQDAQVLKKALEDSVDRVAGYTDPDYGDMTKRLQLVVTDCLVSEDAYEVLEDIQGYAQDKGVVLECYLYMTTDDNDYNSTLEDIQPASKKDAIIILPGISASELVAGEDYTGGAVGTVTEGETIWLPEAGEKLFESSALGAAGDILTQDGLLEVVQSLNMLQLDSRGNSLYSVVPAEVNASNGAMNCAKAMREGIEGAFGDSHDVVFFSYDWRKSVGTAARDLQTYIQKRGYESVTFICHSMGGIVCSYYLTLDQANVDKTRQVITIGTPYGGSPKAAYVFETGRFLENSFPLVDEAFMQVARNYPSVYELLPYDDAIVHNGTYLYQGKTCMGTDATHDYLMNNDFDLNDQMITDALGVQQRLYPNGKHIMETDGLDHTIIAGYATPTVSSLYVDGDRIESAGLSLAGDGTVPLTSAIETQGRLFDSPIYLVDGVKHSDLLGDPDVIALVIGLIDPDEAKGYDTDKISQPKADDKEASDIISRAEVDREDAPDKRDGVFSDVYDILVAYCPVELELYDEQGTLVGSVGSDGISVENAADQVLFHRLDGGESKQVIIPQGYSVKVLGESKGEMDLRLATMNENGEMMQTYFYEDLLVEPEMAVAVEVTDHAPTITVDINGDGTDEQTLEPEDGTKEVYIPMDSGDDGSDGRLWILIGISGGLVLLTGIALVLITVLMSPKKGKKEEKEEVAV